VLASLDAREGQSVATALTALRRKDWSKATGKTAQAFTEAHAGSYRLLYRFERDRIKVALLTRMRDSRPREAPRLDLPDSID
jgi:hypothetical protein